MLVDSHCHLDFPELSDQLGDVVVRARESGVGKMVTICTRVRRFAQVEDIANSYDNIFCTVGTHPHNAAEESDVTIEELVEIAEKTKVIGIGEAGLDFFYNHSPRDMQVTVFRRHIAAARQTGLPLIIHSRDADDEMAAILEEEMGKGAFKLLLHCFSSGASLACKSVELGGYISFSGILTFKKAEELREIASEIPADRLLVETDAPYLAPVPFRGKPNEPSYVRHTAEVLAETRGVSFAAIAAQTTANFHNLFARVPDSNTEAV